MQFWLRYNKIDIVFFHHPILPSCPVDFQLCVDLPLSSISLRRYNKIDIVLFTIKSSWELVALIAFFLILLIIIYATLMYVSERGDWDPVLEQYVRQDEPGVSHSQGLRGWGFPPGVLQVQHSTAQRERGILYCTG
jgi:hypothetical protein